MGYHVRVHQTWALVPKYQLFDRSHLKWLYHLRFLVLHSRPYPLWLSSSVIPYWMRVQNRWFWIFIIPYHQVVVVHFLVWYHDVRYCSDVRSTNLKPPIGSHRWLHLRWTSTSWPSYRRVYHHYKTLRRLTWRSPAHRFDEFWPHRDGNSMIIVRGYVSPFGIWLSYYWTSCSFTQVVTLTATFSPVRLFLARNTYAKAP
jgi:hypothetical protein